VRHQTQGVFAVPQARNPQQRRRVSLDGRTVGSHAPRSFRARLTRRKSLALSSIVPVVLVAAIASGMASASACHPLIQASADCNGAVTFTATAWNGGEATEETRTNTNVQIQYSINGVGGPFETVESAKGTFTKANDFSFGGSFALPPNLKRPTDVTIQAVAVAKWGTNADLDVANQSTKTTIRVPANCDVPTAKIVGPTCDLKSAHAVLTNNSGEPVTFELYRNGAATPFETHAVSKGSVTKTVPVDANYELSIKAKNMKTVTQAIAVPTDCVKVDSQADSQISKVCKADASGWAVSYDNSSNTDGRTFTLKSGDKVLDTVQVEAGKKLTKSYGFAENGVGAGVALPITVAVDGAIVATEAIVNDCVVVAADAAAACDTAAGSGALLTFTNTGQMAETFTVVRDGKAVEGSPFTLEPSDQATQKLLKLDEGDTAVISIISSSGLNIQEQVVLDCDDDSSVPPAEVKGEVVNRAQLADTGMSVLPIAGLGGLLTLTGLGILGIRRRM
jgi:hypothetical protein